MPTIGLVMAWAGYSVFVWGYNKVKSYSAIRQGGGGGSGSTAPLTFSDVVLPSHRNTYLVNMLTAQKTPFIKTGSGQIQTVSQ